MGKIISNPEQIFRLIFFFSSFSLTQFCIAQMNTIEPGQVRSFSSNLSSPDGNYVLGLFRYSKNTYLGISSNGSNDSGYAKVVWVANRDSPIPNSNASLSMDADGVLKIVQDGESPIPLNPNQASRNSSATLMNSGNLVISELNSDRTVKQNLWQSFDYPTDTLLPGMKVGVNLKTGQKWTLSSWRTSELPATGAFSLEWDNTALNGVGELVIKRLGQVYWTSGVITNKTIANVEWLSSDSMMYIYNFSVVSNSDESYFSYSVPKTEISRWVLSWDGVLWDRNRAFFLPEGACDGEANYPGCVRQELPKCKSKGDIFEKRSGYFDGREWQNENFSMGLTDCWGECWKNCSCVGYFTLANGTGCKFWSKGMSFIQDSRGSAAAIYVLKTVEKGKKRWIWIIVGVGLLAIALLVVIFLCMWRMKRRWDEERDEENVLLELTTPTEAEDNRNDGKKGAGDLKVFSFATIKDATNDFAVGNKLGEGGFGPVYKGTLPEGQEIAVKRLSRSSGQGLVEFKNELLLIAKLQHTNLVRLLGCCVKGDEKMLVYEYMPNKSLDFFLFDPIRREKLNWKERFDIIEGIAQGILYLHKYSRLRIIHRDLKASNILLDADMQPKISDFGMARIFGRDVLEANTNRVVGTYGYMSPEYAMEGVFSEKSDVYSFGVLLLEIISGRKSMSSFQYDDHPAWELWRQGRSLELKDPTLMEIHSIPQIQRCIHVGLLCVQENAADRPSMSEIVSMLTSQIMVLPTPKQAAFSNSSSAQQKPTLFRTPESKKDRNSTGITIMQMEPR